MRNQTLELESVVIGRPVQPPRRLSPPATNDPPSPRRDPDPESLATCSVLLPTCFIIPLALVLLVAFIDTASRDHADFSVQSISVSPFNNLSAVSRWTVDFQVKIPSWRCRTYFDGDVVAMLSRNNNDDEPLYGAVLNASRRNSGHHSVFSVDFAAANGKDLNTVVPEVFNLDIKVSGRVRHLLIEDYPGYHNIRCRNLIVGFSMDSMSGTMLGGKKKCKSSFSRLVPPLDR